MKKSATLFHAFREFLGRHEALLSRAIWLLAALVLMKMIGCRFVQ